MADLANKRRDAQQAGDSPAAMVAPVVRWPLLRWVRRGATVLLLLAVVDFLVLPQIAGTRRVLDLLHTVRPGWVVVGVVLEAMSLRCYSLLTRSVLLDGSPRYSWLLRTDLTALGLSHLLPGGGASATALRYRLLRDGGAPAEDAAVGMAVEGVGSTVVLVAMLWVALVVAVLILGLRPLYVTARGRRRSRDYRRQSRRVRGSRRRTISAPGPWSSRTFSGFPASTTRRRPAGRFAPSIPVLVADIGQERRPPDPGTSRPTSPPRSDRRVDVPAREAVGAPCEGPGVPVAFNQVARHFHNRPIRAVRDSDQATQCRLRALLPLHGHHAHRHPDQVLVDERLRQSELR